MIPSQVVANAGAHAPSFGQLVTHVQLDRPGFKPLVLDSLIALGHEAQAACHWHPERASILLGVLDRRLSRRRITGIEILLIECKPAVVALEEIAQPDAQVSAIGASLRAAERLVARALKPESAIIGLQRGGEETRAAPCLQLEPGIGALPQGHVCGAEVASGVPPVGISRQAEPHIVVEPVMALTADGDFMQLV